MNYITWIIWGLEWRGFSRFGDDIGTLPPNWWRAQLEDNGT